MLRLILITRRQFLLRINKPSQGSRQEQPPQATARTGSSHLMVCFLSIAICVLLLESHTGLGLLHGQIMSPKTQLEALNAADCRSSLASQSNALLCLRDNNATSYVTTNNDVIVSAHPSPAFLNGADSFLLPLPKDYSTADWFLAVSQKVGRSAAVQLTNPLATTSEMREYALKLTHRQTNSITKARLIFQALASRAVLSAPQFNHPLTAPQIFAAWRQPGASLRCLDFAYLYTALTRAAGLRSYVVSVDEDYRGDQTPHACAAFLISDRFLLVDIPYQLFGASHRRFRVLDDIEATADYLAQLGGLENCELAYKLDPKSTLVQLNLFTAQVNDHQLGRASNQICRLERMAPNSPFTFQAQAIMALQRNDSTEALRVLDAALRIAPGLHTLYSLRGDAFVQQQKWDEALAAYEGAARRVFYSARIGHLDEMIKFCRAQLACARALVLEKSSNWLLVISNCDVAVQLAPDLSGAYYLRGMAEQSLGDARSSLSDYRKVTQLNPELPHGYIGVVWAQLALGDLASAFTNCDQALRLDPKSADAYYARGCIFQSLGQHPAALTNFDNAISLRPSFAKAFLGRSISEHLESQLNQARADFNKAIELEPALGLAYSNRSTTVSASPSP